MLQLQLGVLLFVFHFLTAKAQSASPDTLRHVFVVYRHGDRAPIRLYTTDPHPENFWKEGLGQLTNIGKRQHYQLGSYLRQRYNSFLTDDIQELYIRSSAVDRCLTSAAANLAALYQPKTYWVWNDELNWQPAPIHSTPAEIDSLLNDDSICPEFDKEYARIHTSPEAQAYIKKHKSLFDYMTNVTGDNITDWDNSGHVHDVLFIEKLYNLTMPSWVAPIWAELHESSNFQFIIPFTTQLSQRLRGGPLVGDIVSIMKQKVQATKVVTQKMHMYSTHDTMVAAFLSALGVFNGISPPYFVTVLLELHENGPHNHTVSMFYRNNTEKDPYPLVIPGCSAACPLGHFIRLTEDIIPINWQEECGLKAEEPIFSSMALLVISVMGAVLLILVFCTTVMFWLRCQKEKNSVRYHRVPEMNGLN